MLRMTSTYMGPLRRRLHGGTYTLSGILHWAVELGRGDLHLSVALMAQYLAQPLIGHLDQVYHIFAYVKAHLHSRIILDATLPRIDDARFLQVDWKPFYPDATEAPDQCTTTSRQTSCHVLFR